MKWKILGIGICMLLISTPIVSAIKISTQENTSPLLYNADVPIWEVGDYWTYTINYKSNLYPDMTLGFTIDSEITFEVVDDSGEFYNLEGTIDPSFGAIDFYLGNLHFKSTRSCTIRIDLQIQKSDLGIYTYISHIEGPMVLSIGPLPLPILIPFEAHVEWECNPIWPMIPFPLSHGDTGIINETRYYGTNGYLKLFWGLINQQFDDSSWKVTRDIPYWVKIKQFTVPAGTFDAYDVYLGWPGEYYHNPIYAVDAGNVIMYDCYVKHDNGNLYFSIDLDLKDFSYSP